MKKVSIIIPCHNEHENIYPLYRELCRFIDAMHQYEWQILLIDDGSQDLTLSYIKSLCHCDKRFSYISFSRNFGKESAMLAGFDHAQGDCAIIMDADLQHPPHIIPQMLQLWEAGIDDVYAQRNDRGKESWLRRKLSLLYYKMLQRIAKTDILPNVGDFRLLDKKCIDSLRRLRETQRYTKGLYCWIGFKKQKITFDQGDRNRGNSSFGFIRLVNLAIEGITSYTTAPLRISTWVGIVVSFTAFIYMCYVLFKTIFVGEPVQGFPTIIIVILFLGGIQLLSLGIIGEYLGRVFNETKQRPPYIIEETNLIENNNPTIPNTIL